MTINSLRYSRLFRKGLTHLLFLGCSFSPGIAWSQCSSQSFQQVFGTSGNEEAYDVAQDKNDNSYYVCGYSGDAQNFLREATITRFAYDGSIAWSKKYSNGNNGLFHRIVALSNGDFVAIGRIELNFRYATHVVRIRASGQVVWSRALDIDGIPAQWGMKVIETNDGNIVLTYNKDHQNTAIVQAGVAKLNGSSGAIIWERLFVYAGASEGRSVVADGDHIIMAGVVFGPGATTNDGFLMKIDHRNGSVVWKRFFDMAMGRNRLNDIKKRGSSFWVTIQTGQNGQDSQVVPHVLEFDTNGNLLSQYNYQFNGKNIDNYPAYWTVPSVDGSMVLAYSENISGGNRPVISKVNKAQVLWAREMASFQNCYTHHVFEDNKGNILVVGRVQANGLDALLIRVTGDTTFAIEQPDDCFSKPTTITTSMAAIVNNNIDWQAETNAGLLGVEDNSVAKDFVQIASPACEAPKICSSFKIEAVEEPCKIGSNLVLRLADYSDCQLAVNWQFDTSLFTLASQDTNTINLRIEKLPNSNTTVAALANGCTQASAQYVFEPELQPISFALGIPDTTICNGDSLLVQISNGYSSVRWNSGDTSRIRWLTSSGVFVVEVQDGCSQTVKDSVILQVTQGIGTDTSVNKCKDEIIFIAPPVGYSNLSWQPSTGVSFDPNTGFAISSIENMPLIIKGTNGACVDSVRIDITQRPSPAFDLGDAEIVACEGTTVTLSAPANFQTLWNTGETSSSITVDSSGIYAATLTDQFGCSSGDSVSVKFGSPDINLLAYQMPSAFTPNGDGLNDCFGLNKWPDVKQVLLFQVFDRWGNLIFQGGKKTDCWDGTNRRTQQQSGAFAYIVSVDTGCGVVTRKGLVTIVR